MILGYFNGSKLKYETSYFGDNVGWILDLDWAKFDGGTIKKT